MLKNYLKIALKVLKRNKLFTGISLFGISFTLTLLFVGTSFFDYFTKANYPSLKLGRTLYVDHLHVWEEKNGNAYRNSYQGSPSYYLLDKHIRSLKTPEKISVFSSHFTKVNSYLNNKKIKLDIKHTDAEFWDILDFEFIAGRPFNKTEENHAQTLAVINNSLANTFFGGAENAIGEIFEADKINYKIIGVVKDVSISSLSAYGNVWVPLATSKSNLSRVSLRGGCSAMILAKNKSDFNKIKNEFQNSISKIEFPIDGYKHIKINAQTIFENFISFIDFNKNQFFIALSIVFLILLAIPSLNLINLNITRIRERESEIGVRKSFGSPTSAILWQFLIENILITLIGGFVAILLTVIILKGIQTTGIIPFETIPINFRIIANSLLFCFLFGFISGILPAVRMSKLQIAKTLQGGLS